MYILNFLTCKEKIIIPNSNLRKRPSYQLIQIKFPSYTIFCALHSWTTLLTKESTATFLGYMYWLGNYCGVGGFKTTYREITNIFQKVFKLIHAYAAQFYILVLIPRLVGKVSIWRKTKAVSIFAYFILNLKLHFVFWREK